MPGGGGNGLYCQTRGSGACHFAASRSYQQKGAMTNMASKLVSFANRSSPTTSAGIEDIELEPLLEGIYRAFGYDFRQYALTTVKRRVAQLMETQGLQNVSELQGKLFRDPT